MYNLRAMDKICSLLFSVYRIILAHRLIFVSSAVNVVHEYRFRKPKISIISSSICVKSSQELRKDGDKLNRKVMTKMFQDGSLSSMQFPLPIWTRHETCSRSLKGFGVLVGFFCPKTMSNKLRLHSGVEGMSMLLWYLLKNIIWMKHLPKHRMSWTWGNWSSHQPLRDSVLCLPNIFFLTLMFLSQIFTLFCVHKHD